MHSLVVPARISKSFPGIKTWFGRKDDSIEVDGTGSSEAFSSRVRDLSACVAILELVSR